MYPHSTLIKQSKYQKYLANVNFFLSHRGWVIHDAGDKITDLTNEEEERYCLVLLFILQFFLYIWNHTNACIKCDKP